MGATPSSSSILSGFSLYKPSISGGIPHGYGNPQYPSIPPINRHGPSPRLKKSSKIIQNHHGPSIALARINAIFRCCASCACGFLGLWCSGFFKTVGYANPKHIFFRAARTSSYLCWGCYLYPHATRVNTKITGIFSRYGQLTWLNVPQQMVSTPLNPQLQHFLVLKRWTITWGEQVWATNTSSMAKDWSLGPLAHSDVLCLLHPNMIWLVVWTPLKNISQLGWLFPIYGKIKNVPNHQPVMERSKKEASRIGNTCSSWSSYLMSLILPSRCRCLRLPYSNVDYKSWRSTMSGSFPGKNTSWWSS